MSAATEPTTITRVVPVDEASQVGDARRAALLVADRAGMDETARGRVALEGLLSSGKLPSRRQHRTDPNKSALQTIMGEVDDLSRDHENR